MFWIKFAAKILDLSKIKFVVSVGYLRKRPATLPTKISMAVFIENIGQNYRTALFLGSP